MKIIWLIAASFALLVPTYSQAAGLCRTIAPGPLENLDKSIKQGHFRVFYTTQGDHAVQGRDSDKNGVPDRVDDVLSQLRAADLFYSNQLGLVAPMQGTRYALATEIAVWLYNLKSGSGIAYDEVIKTAKPTAHGVKMECSLRMDLDTKLDYSKNVSPAHELFHLYQYGQVMFKTRWYLEGMARWVETAFSGQKTGAYSTESSGDLFAKAYNAAPFWQAQGLRITGSEKIKWAIPNLRYVNGELPLKPEVFRGGKAVKPMIDSLAKLTEQISKDRELDPYNWPEKLQRSAEFDTEILQHIHSIGSQSKEN